MTNPSEPGRKTNPARVPGAGDLLAAAQAAVGAAQAAAGQAMDAAGQAIDAAQTTAGAAFDTAVRLPPSTVQLAAQLPTLIDNLTSSVDRLNKTLDRLDRTLALADPAFGAYDRLLPRLEAVVALGEDVLTRISRLPGAAMMGRLMGGGTSEPEPPDPKRPPFRRG